jgi:hypothetical protein
MQGERDAPRMRRAKETRKRDAQKRRAKETRKRDAQKRRAAKEDFLKSPESF